MANFSAVEAGPIVAHCLVGPTIVVLLLIHRTLASVILVLLVLLRSGGIELQGGLEPRLLLAIAKAGLLVPFLLPLFLHIELALAVILTLGLGILQKNCFVYEGVEVRVDMGNQLGPQSRT